jgi:hypothetical protein
MFASFWDYGTTVIGYWQFWVAVAFMLERSLERFLPDFSKRIDPYFTPLRRRQFFIWIAIIAFVYANFRAYDDQRNMAIIKTAETNRVLGERDAVQHENDRLRQGAPSQVAEIQTLQKELAETKNQLSVLQNPPRNDNAIYQQGRQIGTVLNPVVNNERKLVTFSTLTASKGLDNTTPIEFRNMMLLYVGTSTGSVVAQIGANVTYTYDQARFNIIGDRAR